MASHETIIRGKRFVYVLTEATELDDVFVGKPAAQFRNYAMQYTVHGEAEATLLEAPDDYLGPQLRRIGPMTASRSDGPSIHTITRVTGLPLLSICIQSLGDRENLQRSNAGSRSREIVGAEADGDFTEIVSGVRHDKWDGQGTYSPDLQRTVVSKSEVATPVSEIERMRSDAKQS